ncbi:hypothetical protein F441_15305 [Phytophthora nicotianae CJ01A1]|uniref:Uncharacterized protein n=2 Tax=Phytophthora nicotianae TaxID=4792 RepID=W2R3R7_PHYN3|nr:hypothetical protein PPTG_21421 [Phytophthora nicotianae INRA-310]ETN19155.1 hypothetical protein PPTG_21421 [Phytophthora nicotianae INRA-310]ETP08776.1 hypothetical protein F441_15305 [Phytophthora nicotianae CJ01A1]
MAPDLRRKRLPANEGREENYLGDTKTVHFQAFRGVHEKLQENGREVERMLRCALEEQGGASGLPRNA